MQPESWLESWIRVFPKENLQQVLANDWNMSWTVGQARVLRHDSKIQNPKFKQAILQ